MFAHLVRLYGCWKYDGTIVICKSISFEEHRSKGQLNGFIYGLLQLATIPFLMCSVTAGEAPPRSTASLTPTSADASVSADRLSGVAVGLPTVDAVNSTSLRVAWQLLSTSPSSTSQRHQANAVEGYRLRYRLLDAATASEAMSPDDYVMRIVRPGDVSQFIISGSII